MNTPYSYQEIEIVIAALDYQHPNCMDHIASVRLMLEHAYAVRSLSLHQWRMLWEDVSLVQARCAMVQPDAWRCPVVEVCKPSFVSLRGR